MTKRLNGKVALVTATDEEVRASDFTIELRGSTPMSPNRAFSASRVLAMLSWTALSFSLFAPATIRSTIWTATTIAVPGIVGIAYAILLARGLRDGTGGGFGSIAAVRRLFSSDAALAAGWFHYLAFDLFVGTWIAREGLTFEVHRLLILLCLLATLLVGPAGLVLFLVLRFAVAGQIGLSS